jgi:ABC-type uncharacterized transport system YnjBCD ATPase subunit
MNSNYLLRQFIQEHVKSLTKNLLTEQVFGAQAFVYHGSSRSPDILLPALLSDKFTPGYGDMYGKGLYTVYSPNQNQETFSGGYGGYVYKLKVNLYGFIIFDADVCQKVYGSNLSPRQQLQLLGETEAIERLAPDSDAGAKDPKKKLERIGSMTSDRALKYAPVLRQYVKGIIFTGRRDGQVAVIYDPASVVPVAWKGVKDRVWTRVDRSQLKPAIQRSIAGTYGSFDAGRFSQDPRMAFKKGVLNFQSDLNLSGEKITSLPVGLTVAGNLYLDNTGITALPPDLKVGGALFCQNTNLTTLSNGIEVGRDANFKTTKITTVPADFKVGRNLVLTGTPLTTLPDGFSVGGDLYLTKTKITSLPAGLKVGGTLNLDYTLLTTLPTDLEVGESLSLAGGAILSLPAGLTINGNLDLLGSEIMSLPAGLKVKGWLSIDDTVITSLPADLKVGGAIYKNVQRLSTT